MATIKFITVKGNGDLAREPFYVRIPQHERTISAREAYELCAKHTGYKPTAPYLGSYIAKETVPQSAFVESVAEKRGVEAAVVDARFTAR